MAAFDNGESWEAPRLASAAYILLRDGSPRSGTLSILSQLGVKEKMTFISTSKGENGEFMPGERKPGGTVYPRTPLLAIQLREDGIFLIPLFVADEGEPPLWQRNLSFNRWMDEVVYFNDKKHSLTRKNLIFTMRDKDSGGHFDPKINDEAYVDFRMDADSTIRTPLGPLKGGHFATMRQIAWELDKSLDLLDAQLA